MRGREHIAQALVTEIVINGGLIVAVHGGADPLTEASPVAIVDRVAVRRKPHLKEICSMAKSKQNRNQRMAQKRAVVLDTPKRNFKPVLIGMAVAVVALAAAFFFTTSPRKSSPAPTTTTADASSVALPLSLFEDGRARHFEYQDGDLTIRYFVIKSADGVIRAAFDACDVCWPAGKGYYQEGDDMVCRNCGRHFASVMVNEVQGGCNPAPLKRTIQDGQVLLKVEEILAGRTYFNFS